MRCPVKAGSPSIPFGLGQEAIVGDMGGRFASAVGHVELGDGGYAVGAPSERLAGLLEAKTEGADDAGGNDGYAGWATYFVQNVKTRYSPSFRPSILFAFQTEALYTMTPKGENSSSEVRRLSFFYAISGNLPKQRGTVSWRRFPD